MVLGMAEVKNVAIIGFGVMGSGIAQVFAQAGFIVYGMDIDEKALKQGLETIINGPFGLKRAIRKGLITEQQMQEILSRIEVTHDLTEAVKDADIIIEAVVEDLEIKKKVFTNIDAIAPPHAILASNTSSLSITALAAVTKRPEKVIGMHFFNPPQIMKLVEIVQGLQTSNETIELAKQIIIKIGKKPIVCKDIPGFIANRIGILAILEGIRLYEQSAASAEDIDIAMKLGYNWPMGPLELADFIGLDVLLKIAEALYKETGNPSYMPPTILKRMVEAGFLGRKTRKGFYKY